MFRFLDNAGYTAYYKNGVQGPNDNIVKISLDFGYNCLAQRGGIEITRPSKTYEKILRWACIIFTNLLLCLTIYAFFDTNANFQHYIKLFQTLSSVLQLCARWFLLHSNKSKMHLIKLRQLASHFWRIEDLPTTEQSKYLWIYRVLSRLFQIYLLIALVLIVVIHLKTVFGLLPFYTWKPQDSTLGFWIIAVIAAGFVDSCFLTILGFDYLFIATLINVIIQLDILRKKLLNINYQQLSENEINRQIDECASYHTYLLTYISQINATYTTFFLAQYALSVSGACTYMAYLTVMDNLHLVDYIEVAAYVGLLAYQFSLMCLPLGEVAIAADLIESAIFQSTWYEGNGQYKKKLYFMMMSCQKGCRFTAGGLVDINRETLVNISRLCFSVWAFINTTSKLA